MADNNSSINNNRSYDPNIIIKAANDKLLANDVNGGQTLFQSALLNWVDDARENITGTIHPDQMREAIATLWVAYAHFLQTAKQFKSATEAYEQAVECPVSGHVGRIWLDYARFLEDRDKVRSAQQVYLRALYNNNNNNNNGKKHGGAVQDEQDQNLLWNEFLEMMKQQNQNPNLTLAELKVAIQQEQEAAEAAAAAAQNVAPDAVGSTGSPAAKRTRLDNSGNSGGNTNLATGTSTNNNTPMNRKQEDDVNMEDDEAPTRTHVVTAADIDVEKIALQELVQSANTDPGFLAAWMVRDGDAPPQAPLHLFSAAPPKLSDPTGKDLLGEKLALQLVQRLLLPSDGTVVLQVCRGLWMLTALKEEQSQKALLRLDATVQDELKKLQARLHERLSVAGAAEAAVRQINNAEEQSFQDNCNQQRLQLLSSIAWDVRQLLWVQQQLLTKLQIPGFQGTTVDASELEFQARVCSYLHSAFFLRQRIGQAAHANMLKSQQERLQQMMEDKPQVVGLSSPARGGTGRLSPGRSGQRTMTPPPPSMQQQQQSFQQQQQQQQQQAYNMAPPPPPPPPGYYNPGQQQQPQMMMPPPNMSGYPQQPQNPPNFYHQ